MQKKIREIFLEQIVKAKGLSRAQDLIQGILMPTPSAMLTAMKLLAKGSQNEDGMGDLVGVDLGGATHRRLLDVLRPAHHGHDRAQGPA